MLNILTYPRDGYNELELDKNKIVKLIAVHRSTIVPKLLKNKRYYDGTHDILSKTRRDGAPNTKTVCNHAKDIADTASGYFMGNPITYNNTGETDIERLLVAFDTALIDDADSDNALNMAIYGVAYEYIYAREGEAELSIKELQPENTFIVYDDSIEQQPLFGVYYYVERNSVDSNIKYIATVVTEHYKYILKLNTTPDIVRPEMEPPQEHNMGDMPIVEYRNNKDCIGDYEQQIGLIDAYNTLMSDRVNDKEQFIDALLVLYGSMLGDTEEEVKEAAKTLREDKIIEMPIDAKAEYLTRTLDETGAETLRKALKQDIYTFSHVPNLTDENFVGNSSGVAMEYKLLGLEMITKIKERYYRKGLRKRIQIFCNYLGLKQIALDAKAILPEFSRALPKNIQELAQTIANLKDTVSQRTLLSLLPFVEDPDNEIEEVNQQKEENIKQQKAAFGLDSNAPPDEDGEEDE